MEKASGAPPAQRHGMVFDQMAAEYDRNRWTYPEELVDRACQVAGIKSGDRVLEVGCGTGQLTRSLVARALRVTALDPGKQMLSLAKQNLEGVGEAEFLNARFEDAQLPSEHFPVLFSASAFHWIEPEVSWRKAAQVLIPGGTLALIQYCGLLDQHSTGDEELVLLALTRVAPEIAAVWPRSRNVAAILAGVEERRENISEVWAWLGNYEIARTHVNHFFRNVQVATVSKIVEHTASELNAIFGTTSFSARLSPNQREALKNEYVAIHERLGRPIRSGTVAVVVTAQGCAAG
jgi:ubiquinone/menaquinone biosynthesis C-methylase UbiE